MWRQIEQDLDSKTTLLVETGDSWLNGMYTRLPGGARFEIEMQYGSIGWSVPASFGYGMGLEPDRRLVSVIGDGSFQLTAQEVSNMIRHGQETLIFLVNNHGYVIESAIHDGPYNYYKNWDYAGLIDCVQRRRRPRARANRNHRRRTGRCHRQSPRPQGRAGPDRMPDPQRRRQPRADLLGLQGGQRQRPPGPAVLKEELPLTHSVT